MRAKSDLKMITTAFLCQFTVLAYGHSLLVIVESGEVTASNGHSYADKVAMSNIIKEIFHWEHFE